MGDAELREPLVFEPIYKDKIWGGRAFETKLSRVLSASLDIGESWELSGYGEEQSTVESGPFKGRTLGELFSRMGPELTGSLPPARCFPLLYKFIDACNRLSVQVHPDDFQAQAEGWGELGKTECWYIVDAKKDAQIIAGFKNDVARSEIVEAVKHNRLEEFLNYVAVAPGDMLFIPAGTVHAILDEILIYEVQETSDTTLRLYDWGRTDAAGVQRQLHVEDALKVITTRSQANPVVDPVLVRETGFTHAYRVACRYFAVEQYAFTSDAPAELPPAKSFKVITALSGSLSLNYFGGRTLLQAGRTALVPASVRELEIAGSSGTQCLLSYVPDLTNDIIIPLKSLGVSPESIASLGGNGAKNDLISLL